jgi:hypothetical protein
VAAIPSTPISGASGEMRALLRKGNVHIAEDWRSVLAPVDRPLVIAHFAGPVD